MLLGWKASTGQFGPEPLQFSARSHAPATARHCTVFALKASAGHAGLPPGQVSATSHTPFAARQVVPAATYRWMQPSPEPSQVSSRSQAWPELALQIAPIGRLASMGQVVEVPLQASG